jgi:hypothetical protein
VLSISRSIATAALAAVVLFGQAQTKRLRDTAEHDLYNSAIKDTDNPAKEIQDLEAWERQYPDSDFADDRLYMYVQAYSKVTPAQPQKVVEYGQRLINKGLATAFPPPGGTLTQINVLYLVAWSVAALPNPAPAQLTLGDRAARDLLDLLPRYFVPANRPPNTSETDWRNAWLDLDIRARTALVSIALNPGKQAMEREPKDCAAAEKIFMKVLEAFPGRAPVSYQLGTALDCLARQNPDQATEIAPRAIYQFLRAAAIDPALGGAADPKKITAYADEAYIQFHGSNEGLDALKAQVKTSPLPPVGFTIETASSVAQRKQQEFAEKNPEYAMWMAVKAQLTSPTGQQYFDGQFRNTVVSLKGVVVEGRPSCRPRELSIAIPAPGEKPDRAEITLRLDSAIPGRVAPDDTVQFEATPKLLSQHPLMVTMDAARTAVKDLKIQPCTPSKK